MNIFMSIYMYTRLYASVCVLCAYVRTRTYVCIYMHASVSHISLRCECVYMCVGVDLSVCVCTRAQGSKQVGCG